MSPAQLPPQEPHIPVQAALTVGSKLGTIEMVVALSPNPNDLNFFFIL